jgi:hypothetical protein
VERQVCKSATESTARGCMAPHLVLDELGLRFRVERSNSDKPFEFFGQIVRVLKGVGLAMQAVPRHVNTRIDTHTHSSTNQQSPVHRAEREGGSHSNMPHLIPPAQQGECVRVRGAVERWSVFRIAANDIGIRGSGSVGHHTRECSERSLTVSR